MILRAPLFFLAGAASASALMGLMPTFGREAGALAGGNTSVEHGPVGDVQEFTIGGDPGNVALRSTRAHLAGAGRKAGSQSANHFQAVAEGSGANGEANADITASFSLVKRDWASYAAARAGEADVITCNGRNGGPIAGLGAGLSDMNCLTINIQNSKGSGYLAGIEASVSDVDPRHAFAIDHAIGFQLGVVNSRDDDYEGVVAISNGGRNDAAFHAQSSANGSFFALYQKDTAVCPGAANNLQDVFTQDTPTGTMTWIPCRNAGAKSSLGVDGRGNLVVKNDAGAPMLAVDQGGNVTTAGTPILPNYTFEALRSVSAAIKGRMAFCTDCLKPGETIGAGTGLLVFSDGRSTSSWFTSAGTTVKH